MQSKIEDATLFILWKFERVLDDPLSHEHQVSFALVHTTNAFGSVVELRKSLTESKKTCFRSLTSRMLPDLIGELEARPH